jgi:fimbrial chaperone protein
MCNRSGCVRCVAAVVWLVFFSLASPASAQGITVMPVNIEMRAGQMSSVLTVVNQGDRKTAFQIRAFAWQLDQKGDDQLKPTDELLASPPLATLAPHATQIVRLVLRRPPQGREATYRILFDQLAPAAETGVVHIVLRLSIPVFAQPPDRLTPQVQWRIVSQKGQAWLVAVNRGTRHQTVRDVTLHTADGRSFKIAIKAPPHILAGGSRRWHILADGRLPGRGTTLRLTANADTGAIDQPVRIDAEP